MYATCPRSSATVRSEDADIYCDTQLILREIERRAPEPTLYPSQTRGLADALGWWAERSLFSTAVAVLFAKVWLGLAASRIPPPSTVLRDAALGVKTWAYD